MLIVQADEINILCCGERSDGSRRSTGYDEGCINLTVLQSFGAVTEGLVGCLNVIFYKPFNKTVVQMGYQIPTNI